MTRAEEIALETFPKESLEFLRTGRDFNGYRRQGFIQGYERAEKDMKERFIQFVHRHYPINYIGWIQDFQKAMED